MRKEIERIIGEYQTGFRNSIQVESFEHKKNTHTPFVDFKLAYGRVDREQLLLALKAMKMHGMIIAMIKIILHHSENRIKINKLSEKLYVRTGVRQGDPLPQIYSI